MKNRKETCANKDEACLISSIEMAKATGNTYIDEESKSKKLREKKRLKMLSTFQNVTDGMMALADIRDGKV
ncbi:hypothetical protein QQ045_013049 [Rhodiola kirilowii]